MHSAANYTSHSYRSGQSQYAVSRSVRIGRSGALRTAYELPLAVVVLTFVEPIPGAAQWRVLAASDPLTGIPRSSRNATSFGGAPHPFRLKR